MNRRTKIVCTLGPSTDQREVIRALIAAGMDVARMNFSHGTHDEHRRRIEMVRDEARRAGRVIPILQDLQGPKIRVGKMEGGGVLLHEGQTFTLTSEPIEVGTKQRATVSYEGLAADVNVGGTILMDDGNIELCIVDVNGKDVRTEVVVGGPLRSKKGVNLPHIRSSTPSLTDKDLTDLEFGLENDVDLIALSFVRTQSDVQDLLRRIQASGKSVSVVSKIEKPEAVDDFDNILEQTDAVMVARGDLGIEMPMQR
ncbi:MAG: pyruvate kinase, partial [Bacteroidota bacterium]